MASCLCTWLACASAAPTAQPEPMGPAVSLTLAKPNGELFSLSTLLAGRPRLLFLFATYDTASQVALSPLQTFLERDDRVEALGIALQPNARSFIGIYRDALDVHFPVAYDPEDTILQGTSDLGAIEGIPAFIVLDGEGRVRATRYGAATEQQLDELVTRALGR